MRSLQADTRNDTRIIAQPADPVNRNGQFYKIRIPPPADPDHLPAPASLPRQGRVMPPPPSQLNIGICRARAAKAEYAGRADEKAAISAALMTDRAPVIQR